ncbi:thioredoxin family protein [Reichenbachiella agarivorans]|uniref:Thioredoxin family protein n=1 Tax=Reichenbachiella agarivorans TaxID=2979464 RepID=A0ABY6CTR4_9BACT|nr:thioredoxin family protein [Reichenbachiella agarivorans]UXP33905.1 thioredoxin family protein [Reichenbachiella agarivorans]
MKKILSIITIELTMLFMIMVSTAFAPKSSDEGYKVGDTATSFKLKNVDGKFVSPADYKSAKGFIVVFTCNTCPYSKLYESRIDALNLKYADKGYPVLAINSNDPVVQPGDSYDEMVKLAKSSKYSFPYLQDTSQEIAKSYGATKTPHVYVLEKQGADLKVAYIGAIDNNPREAKSADVFYVEDAVNSLLEGKPVKTTTTKAIGCTIKWKQA